MVDRAWTVPAFAEHLCVDDGKILKLIGTGEIEAINIAQSRGGRPRWRILPEAAERFLRSRSNTPPTPEAPRRKRRQAVESFF